MSWPTTGAGSVASGYLASGVSTYFRWGTDEAITVINGVTVSGFLTIMSINQKRKKEDMEWPQGDGVQAGRTQIIHGVVWEARVRDDTRITGLPTEGTSGTIVDMAGLLGAVGGTYTAYLLTSDYDAALKQPGERVLVFERIQLIEG